MCQECGHIHGHAGQCPMNPKEDEPIMKTCPICEREFDEELVEDGVCTTCLTEQATYETAIKYGAERKQTVEINGFLAYAFDKDEIEEALMKILEEIPKLPMPPEGEFVALDYCFEDTMDFADWLVKQKEKRDG